MTAAARPRQAQTQKLLSILSANAKTRFGTDHDFALIKNCGEFRDALPIRSYSDFQPWIERIADGSRAVLTAGPVEAFEETSGSTGYCKLIPYTRALKAEFEAAIGPWTVAMSRQYPGAFRGSAYWSLSPPVKPRRHSQAGIPIGMVHDLEYFQDASAQYLAEMMAVPPTLSRISDPTQFYRETLKHLLNCRDLSMISVWSPTFFLRLDHVLRNDPSLTANIDDTAASWSELWPDLALLSCWTDAQSALWLSDVQSTLGDAAIQGKGLLATEAVSTVPMYPDTDPVPAVSSHYFEYRENGSDRVFMIDELTAGRIYEVIVTTSGGLYRYVTGDLVRVTSILNNDLPAMRFIGRASRQSDLVGEKLSEWQVNEAITLALRSNGSKRNGLLFLYPLRLADGRFSYTLFGGETPATAANLRALADEVELNLGRNPYYKQAVGLGQLHPVMPKIVPELFCNQITDWLAKQHCIRDGDQKIPALFLHGDLEQLHIEQVEQCLTSIT